MESEVEVEVKPVVESEIKEGDVFRFRYNYDPKIVGWDSRGHCFEGILVAKFDSAGRVTLLDTYWGLDGRDGRWFTVPEAQEKGTLTFYVNLNDIESIRSDKVNYYDDADLFTLSTQNACSRNCIYHYKRKGAEVSQKKLLSVVDEKLRGSHRELQSVARDIERWTEMKTKIELGNLEVYL